MAEAQGAEMKTETANPSDLLRTIEEAKAFVSGRIRVRPEVGIVLGTGLGQFAAALDDAVVLPYSEIPHMPVTAVESHAANLERAARILPGFAFDPRSVEGRVAFRAVTADRLPVVGKLEENLFAAFAYGSRGLLWSTLGAELIAAELEGEPLPVEGTLADALSPGRFARRAARRTATRQSG